VASAARLGEIALPPIEAVRAGPYAAADREANQPEHKKQDRCDPQQMYCESCSEEDQDEQQAKKQNH
jgi:hypothetical protein